MPQWSHCHFLINHYQYSQGGLYLIGHIFTLSVLGQYIWRLVKNRIWEIFCHWDENTWYISRGFSHMVNLSTYLKSLLHLANQPGQFQIKGGANSKFRIEQKPYIKNIKKCSELIIYDSWNFTTIKHICWFTSDSIKYIFDQASQYSNLSDFLSAGLYPIFGLSGLGTDKRP